MAVLRTRTVRLALAIAAALLAATSLAIVSSLTGCGREVVVSPDSTPSVWGDADRSSQAAAESRPGALALATAQVLASAKHPRAADTWGEIRAREFIYGTFQQYDYVPLLQEFIGGAGERRIHSANIVAVKEGQSDERVIIAAHYDAASGEGYVDNAVGVGLLLELAARLKARPTPYTLVFVALGAEEPALLGSRHFAAAMSKQERGGVVGLIDLEAVAGGDRLYVLTKRGAPAWLRDDVLAAAQEATIDVRAVPDETGPIAISASHDAFAAAGIATAVLTAGNWETGSGRGNVQTEDHGLISGSGKDTVRFIEKAYPGRVEAQLSDLSRLLEILLTSKLETHS